MPEAAPQLMREPTSLAAVGDSAGRTRVLLGVPRLGWAVVVIWAVVQLVWLRPVELAADWNGWRQADTQSMARGFYESGDDLFHPRIRWGGDGPGYVESELALYPYLIALGMRCFGPAPLIGQLLSTLCIALSALLVAGTLRRRLGSAAAVSGMLVLLGCKALLHVASAVQPEALCVLGYSAALAAFVRYSEPPHAPRWLLLYTGCAAVACLVKPTAVQIVIAPAVVALCDSSLRRRLWQLGWAWLVIVTVLALYLLHARSLYLTYGNTFGILSGGDRKTPRLEHLLHPKLYASALLVFVEWGLGLAGALALGLLAWRRRLDAWLLGFALAAAAWALASLRYSSFAPFGWHYTVLGAVLAAWATAGVVRDAADMPQRSRHLVLALLTAAACGQAGWSYAQRYAAAHADPAADPGIQLGRALRRLAPPNTLVIVRSDQPSYHEFWKTPNNFQDPTIMYVSWTRGFIIPNDLHTTASLDDFAERGARFFTDQSPEGRDPAISQWLRTHGQLVKRLGQAELWRLAPTAAASSSRRSP